MFWGFSSFKWQNLLPSSSSSSPKSALAPSWLRVCVFLSVRELPPNFLWNKELTLMSPLEEEQEHSILETRMLMLQKKEKKTQQTD